MNGCSVLNSARILQTSDFDGLRTIKPGKSREKNKKSRNAGCPWGKHAKTITFRSDTQKARNSNSSHLGRGLKVKLSYPRGSHRFLAPKLGGSPSAAPSQSENSGAAVDHQVHYSSRQSTSSLRPGRPRPLPRRRPALIRKGRVALPFAPPTP